MEQRETEIIEKAFWRLKNPHDRFCRQTIFHPLYASDFLKSYGDSLLVDAVDLDYLVEAPTTRLSDELKEVISDGSLATRLFAPKSMTEVLLFLEHKSRPSRMVALQLLTEAVMSLHHHWMLTNRSESKNVKLPIPIMVVVYNGNEDWDGEIWFHDLFPDLSDELRSLVPQFRVIFINLRRYKYGHLPGNPATQAAVESLLRATDGTFIDHLPRVFQHVADAGLGELQRLSLSRNISFYSSWTGPATAEQITKAITTVFKGQEGINMAETIKNSFILEGIEIGEARGELKGKVEAILSLLQFRFTHVPESIAEELNSRTDLTALQSLFALAYQCETLDEFAEALK